MFYDGFGLDLRVWAVSYVRTLTLLNYKVIYITDSNSKHKIPHIKAKLKSNIIEFYFKDKGYIQVTKQLKTILKI